MRLNTNTNTNTTRTATRTAGPYTWDVIEVARYRVEVLRWGHWTQVGGYFDTETQAHDDAERMVRIFRHHPEAVRVSLGGWTPIRHA